MAGIGVVGPGGSCCHSHLLLPGLLFIQTTQYIFMVFLISNFSLKSSYLQLSSSIPIHLPMHCRFTLPKENHKYHSATSMLATVPDGLKVSTNKMLSLFSIIKQSLWLGPRLQQEEVAREREQPVLSLDFHRGILVVYTLTLLNTFLIGHLSKSEFSFIGKLSPRIFGAP